jgi:hypothetical protein
MNARAPKVHPKAVFARFAHDADFAHVIENMDSTAI